jgi:secreted PhoX family phosphatase
LGLKTDPDDRPSSPAGAPCFQEVLAQRLSRRGLLKLLAAGGLMACAPPQALHGPRANAASRNPPELLFTEIPRGLDEGLHVPPGYEARPVLRWGDPLFPRVPEFDPLAQTAASQRAQFGYNNDFVAFMPLGRAADQGDSGLLVVNHEFTQAPMMFPGAPAPLSLKREQVEVEIAAHGLSIAEIRRQAGAMCVYR